MSDSAETTPATASQVEKRAGSVFSHGAFNRLFVGSFFGAFADRLYLASLMAAANIIYAQSSPEDQKGKIQIVATIPLLLLYGLSGSLVDSVNRRALLVWVKGLKALGVLLFVPLLWQVVKLAQTNDSAIQQSLAQNWFWCMLVIVLLNVLTVPFGPARAAAIPDVTPEEHRSIAASLMATSGLLALLVAAAAAALLAVTTSLGPALTMVVACGCYVVSTLLFKSLPDAVAVPGNKRPVAPGSEAAPANLTMKEYIRGQWDGVKYVCRRASVLGLVFFESAFWTFGSAFYILLDFHGRTAFGLSKDALTAFSGYALLSAGVGLFTGALSVGKLARRVSPILTYAPAFLLLAVCMYAVFRAEAAPGGGAPGWIFPMLFGLGLSGGALLGRVDADVLAITEPQIRGRVFSLKALAFAITIMVTLVYITLGDLSDDEKRNLTVWMPRAFLILIPLAAFFSWAVDAAIYGNTTDTEGSNWLHRLGYRAIHLGLRIFMKVYFRYEVRGAEKIPQSGPVVLAANHGSFADPLFLACCTPRIVQYIMYASYYRSLAHPLFRFLRCIPVDEKSASAALKAGVRSLKKGVCVGIFPEGQVSRDGNLQPAMGGALFLAQRCGATVVPVALKGNSRAFGRSMWIPRPAKLTVIVGTPFQLGPDSSKDEMLSKTDQMMNELAALLELSPPQKKPKADDTST